MGRPGTTGGTPSVPEGSVSVGPPIRRKGGTTEGRPHLPPASEIAGQLRDDRGTTGTTGGGRRELRRAANSTATSGARRVIGRPWKPGQSGNPSGLPRDIPAAVHECRRLALSHVPRAVQRLAELLDSSDERVVAAAATAIMDRAGVAPRAWEGERLEVAVVDVDALRAKVEERLARLQPVDVQPALPASPSEAAGAGDREPRPLAPEEGDPDEAA